MNPPRLIKPSRQQRVLLPESLDELLPQEHTARVFARAIEMLDMSPFLDKVKARQGVAGKSAVCPSMLLLAWLYATSQGISSSREIVRLSKTDLAFRWIFGGIEVKKTRLADFRVAHLEKLQVLFTDLLATLIAADLVKLDFVAVDGVRVRADAGRSSYRYEEGTENIRQQAGLHVKAVFSQADDPTVSNQVKRAREAKAKDFLERSNRALEQVRKLQAHHDALPPSKKPEKPPKASTTDPEARVMKLSHSEFGPGYTAQTAVAGDEMGGPRTVVGLHVTTETSDRNGPSAVLDDAEARTKKRPKVAVADEGFLRLECVEKAHAKGIELFVPMSRAAGQKKQPTEAVKDWRTRMSSEQAGKIMRRRASTAELPYAPLKERQGLRRLPVRGLEKVTCVFLLNFLVINIVQHASFFRG